MTTSSMAQIRKALNIAFDDSALSAFCFDYFAEEVYDRFSQGMHKNDKMTLLLDHCRRQPTGFKALLDVVRQEYQTSNSPRYVPLIDALLEYTSSSLRIASTTKDGSGSGKEVNSSPLIHRESKVTIISEDGVPVSDDEVITPPLEAFGTGSFLALLDAPGGGVKLRDRLYVERAADAQLKQEIIKWGSTTTLRAPRQTGKTSLLVRGKRYAEKKGAKVVYVDFQGFSDEQLSSPDLFLREFAMSICDELGLDGPNIEKALAGKWNRQQKLTFFLENQVLPQFDVPVVLAIDEADSFLETSFRRNFFGLVRFWHNRRASHPEEWEKLNLVLVISTEPYLLIDDLNQSPFNVGLKLQLADFTDSQVQWLNQQHGSPVKQREFSDFMALLGGQPYLTRKALYQLVTQKLSWSALAGRAATDQGPFGEHLRRHYWALRHQPELSLRAALKEVIDSNRCSDDTARLRLLRAGLIKEKENGECTCRCGLYSAYFEGKL